MDSSTARCDGASSGWLPKQRRSQRPGSRWLGVMIMTAASAVASWGTAQDATPPGFRAMELREASAADVAPRVQQMLKEAEPSAEVLVDQRRNQIMVRGSQAAQRLAIELVQTLDRTPADRAPRDAELIVRGYPVDRQQLASATEQLRRRYPAEHGVRVATDDRTGQLVVVAPAAVHQEIEKFLGTGPSADSRGTAATNVAPAPTTTEVTRLKNIQASDVEGYLRATWGTSLEITADESGRLVTARVPGPGSNMTVIQLDRGTPDVRITAPSDLQASWRQLIGVLDATPQPSQTTQLFPVRAADPERIRYAIGLLQVAAQQAADNQGQLQDNQQQQQFQLDQFDNQPEDPDDQPDDLGQQPQEEEPAIEAQPGQMTTEEAIQAAEEAGLLGDVQIEYIPELGLILIKGNQADVARVRRIIADIEEKSLTLQPEINIVHLRHVNSQALAAMIVQIYESVFAPRQGALSITALDKPNAVLLIGRKETMQAVLDLIAKLDQPVPAATQIKVFRLQHISAVDAERLVRGFFVNQPGGGAAGQAAAPGGAGDLRPGLGTRARVLAEYRSNSLIVQAAPRDLAEVALFINSIDRESPEATHEIRVFHLSNTLALDLAPILQGAITGTAVAGQQQAGGFQQGGQFQQGPAAAAAGQTTPPSTKLTIVGVDSIEHRLIESGVVADVTVTADPNTNSLVVRGPARSMELIGELIRQLDQAPSAAAQIKVFHIKNGDATSLAAMLQTLFGQQVTAGQGNLTQTLRQVFGDVQGLGATTGQAESTLIPLRFAVDVRTNSIIASGTTGDLEVVHILLLRLDQGDIETRKMFVYRLKNAPALDVANSIAQFLNNQRQLIQQQLILNQAVSPFEQIDREVIVVPELVSNSLIVSATPRYSDQILQIIEDLDFRPPMVMVQVMICEVALTDDFEFGVELGLQDSLLFDRSVVNNNVLVPGFNFNNQPLGNSSSPASLATREDLAGQALSNFALGRSSANVGYGGLVLSAANESVSILVRALQDAGRLQILSRPSVMTLDNQVAFVQVGARVPRITGSTIQPQGGTQTQTTDVDVGLLLRIQPRINQDGLVVMNIDAEKSEVGNPADGIPVAITDTGQVINSPQINTTTAQTTISANSGQTVVFAGLITKNRSIVSRRVPLLSDIPLLGRLFRFDAESEARTELLIFMTPYIVRDDEDYDWLKYTESERMSWCLGDVVEMHGDVGLSGGHGLWGPPVAPLIYPDLDPTGGELIHTPLDGQYDPNCDPLYDQPLEPYIDPQVQPYDQPYVDPQLQPQRDPNIPGRTVPDPARPLPVDPALGEPTLNDSVQHLPRARQVVSRTWLGPTPQAGGGASMIPAAGMPQSYDRPWQTVPAGGPMPSGTGPAVAPLEYRQPADELRGYQPTSSRQPGMQTSGYMPSGYQQTSYPQAGYAPGGSQQAAYQQPAGLQQAGQLATQQQLEASRGFAGPPAPESRRSGLQGR